MGRGHIRRSLASEGLVYLVLWILSSEIWARDAAARYQFKKANPCPYSREQGCIIDHIIPLACGGIDHPENMQWQTKAEAKAKDKWERKRCRSYPISLINPDHDNNHL